MATLEQFAVAEEISRNIEGISSVTKETALELSNLPELLSK